MGFKKWMEATQRAQKNKSMSAEQRAIEELEQFMSGIDGTAARELLAATEQKVHCGEAGEVCGSKSTWHLTPKGLIRSTEDAKQLDAKPTEVELEPQLFVLEVMRSRKFASPQDIVSWIHTELDRIADSIR